MNEEAKILIKNAAAELSDAKNQLGFCVNLLEGWKGGTAFSALEAIDKIKKDIGSGQELLENMDL